MTHVLKFNDYISEGFIGKTLDKFRTGEIRIENEPQSNIKSIKPVDIHPDFPFLFADKDVYMDIYDGDDDDTYTFDDVVEHEKLFAKYGWRVPTHEDVMKIEDIYENSDDVDNMYRNFIRIDMDDESNGKANLMWTSDMNEEDGESGITWHVSKENVYIDSREFCRCLHIRLIKDK